MRRPTDRLWLAAVLPLQALAVCAMAWITPPGEAPDEPAHLWYVAKLAETGVPPSRDLAAPTVGYEAHQSPLGYLPAAAVAAAVDLEVPGESDWPRDPGFSFHRPTRAFAVERSAPGGVSRRDLLAVRLAGLGWLAVTTGCGLVAVGRSLVRADVLCVFALAPQLVFLHAVVTNDGAVVAASTVALLLLFQLDRPAGRRVAPSLGAGVSLGLAVWCKASALSLVPVAAAGAVYLWRRGRAKAAGALVAGLGVPLAGWVAMNLVRFGSLLPEPPTATGLRAEAALQLLRPWSWVPGLAASFWAKLGWLNVPLPGWCYLWFAVPSVLVVLGLLTLARRRSRTWAAGAAAVAVASNLVFLLVYLVAVDFQPQGRLLWPSWLGMAVLASRAMDRWGPERQLPAPALAVSAALLGVAVAALLRL